MTPPMVMATLRELGRARARCRAEVERGRDRRLISAGLGIEAAPRPE